MKKIFYILLISSISTSLFSQINVEKYLWEYPLQQNLVLNTDVTATLQSEMQRIIDTGNLMFRPLTCRYGDLIYDNYLLYHEPGRIFQTVALAYPYLNEAQKTTLRPMVAQLLNNNAHAPWSASPLNADAGTRREFYKSDIVWGLNSNFGSYRPTIQGVYSLWLYLYRSGDTAAIQPHYSSIRDFYNSKVGNNVDPGNLYGTMCAHIGMARLAKIFNDSAQVNFASSNLSNYLIRGLDMHYVDSMAFYGKNGWNAPYANEYDFNSDNWVYRGYIFLNLSPEIGRYLKDTLFTQVSQRHTQGLQRFPLWWIRQTPYFTRWTGYESIGIPSESFGMFTPVERWVMNGDAETMVSYLLSSPLGVADCYWIEALVYTLESGATDEWVDVRSTPFSTFVDEFKTLNLTVFPEGLYNPITQTLRKACDENGEHFTGTVADQLSIRLAQPTAPYTVLFERNNVNLNQNGTCSVHIPSGMSGSYYIIIKHRNSIETWSATPLSFSETTVQYDFTDAAGKTFGNNACFLNGRYCMYAGDVNQDLSVNEYDMDAVYYFSSTFAKGYISADVNGDGTVDSDDMILIDNNLASSVGSITP